MEMTDPLLSPGFCSCDTLCTMLPDSPASYILVLAKCMVCPLTLGGGERRQKQVWEIKFMFYLTWPKSITFSHCDHCSAPTRQQASFLSPKPGSVRLSLAPSLLSWGPYFSTVAEWLAKWNQRRRDTTSEEVAVTPLVVGLDECEHPSPAQPSCGVDLQPHTWLSFNL